MTAALRARAGRRATAAPAAHPARDIRPQRLHCFFSAMVGPSQRGSCGGTPFNGGPEVRDCHFPDGRRYRRDRLLHLRLSNRADTADAEGFNLRELAGIQREASAADSVIENWKTIVRIRRRMPRCDDRRLNGARQKRYKAQLLQAAHQRLAVTAIACPATGNAALCLELLERASKRCNDRSWRRESPLLGTHIRLPLIVKVERERMTVPFARFQRALAHDGETHSRNTLQTLS